jgi:serine/threonine protein kinase
MILDNEIPKQRSNSMPNQQKEIKFNNEDETEIEKKREREKENNEKEKNDEKEEILLENYILGKTIGEGTFGKVKLGINKLTEEKVNYKYNYNLYR